MELTSPYLEVGLVSNDADRLIAFYSEGLGFPVVGSIDIPNVGKVTRFQVGNCVLRLLVPVQRAEGGRADIAFSAIEGIRYIALKVRDLGGAVDHISKRGGSVIVPIRALRPGVDVAIVADPDGNAIELMQEAVQ